MNIQPFRPNDPLIVEARNADGTLRFDVPQPPARYVRTTLDKLYADMFRELPTAEGTWAELKAWLAAKSWAVRSRTWPYEPWEGTP